MTRQQLSYLRSSLKERHFGSSLIRRNGKWVARCPSTYRHMETNASSFASFCRGLGLIGTSSVWKGRRGLYAAVWSEFTINEDDPCTNQA